VSPDDRRLLPSVSALLEQAGVRALAAATPRELVVDAARAAVEEVRARRVEPPAGPDGWDALVAATLAARLRPSLRPLFNATGVVLHTNLGRAPLAPAALAAIAATAAGFSNLEYDVERGERGSRYAHCVSLLTELTGADDALVVNNCAAALVLALNTLADGRDAVISRGELVEIGGSFRVPDIMAKSGARLAEVGTTNRTHLGDYRSAAGPATGAFVKVHRSNFTLTGFVAEVAPRDLARLGDELGVPLLHDFGSGLLLPLDAYGLSGEPTAADAVRDGATAVVMSGDKLLGGPQAGIILGRRDAIAAMRRNPLTRALRVDKLTLAALSATLGLYREPERAVREVPALAMLTAPPAEVRGRAERLRERLAAAGAAAGVEASDATVGGGAFPSARIPSAAVVLAGDAAELERRLRLAPTAVIARIADGRVWLDLRSVPAAHDAAFGDAVLAALA
jgi:L-seryl-tRNA(Ser) seleniumtransferase